MQNNESILQQSRPPKAVNSSGWQSTAIAVVIIALIAGAGGYLMGLRTAQNLSQDNQKISLQPSLVPTREPSPSSFVPKTFYPIPTTNPVLTANWKTYKSDRYGITFRYPPHIYPNPLPCPTIMYGNCPPDDITFQTKQIPPDGKVKSYEEYGSSMFKGVIDGALKLFFRDIDREDKLFSKDPAINHWADYKDGDIVIREKTGRIASGYLGEKRHRRNIKIPLTRKKYLEIDYFETVITLDEFNQMLSTFKFTKQH